MTYVFELLSGGFLELLSIPSILAMVVGVFLGTIFGSLPGLSATSGMALMLPICFSLEVSTSLLMLAGIYSGALYGGSISAILLGIPGTAAALPTTFDGYPMTRQGRAYEGLLSGLYGSSIGGITSAVVLMFLTPPIAAIAIRFGAPEMFALGLWGISMVVGVLDGAPVKGFFMAALGLLIGAVGAAPATGEFRFTFGSMNMIGGFSLVPLLLGCLALSGVYAMMESFHDDTPFFQPQKDRKYFLRPGEVIPHLKTVIRSAIVGCVVGIAPAAGPTIAAMMSYNLAKQDSDEPEKFGKGNVEGVWASETANNAATGGSLVFALSLGIPGSAAAAVLMSALVMRGVQPGPLLLVNNSNLVYTFFAGFLAVNFIVWMVGHFFIQMGSKVLKTPLIILVPSVIVICVIGAFSGNNSMFGVYVAFGVSLFAFVLVKMKFPIAPFLLSTILSSIIESNYWTMYSMTRGNLLLVFKRPMFLVMMAIAIISFGGPYLKKHMDRIKRRKADTGKKNSV